MYSVGIERVKNGDLHSAISNAMNLVDWKARVKKGGTVVVKPNMGCFTYSPGIITRPEVVFEVVKNLLSWADEVIVGESDGVRYSCDDAFIATGVKRAVEDAGGKVINFSKDKQVPVSIEGIHWKEVILPKTIADADSFVSIPVPKTHEITKFTCGIKNQFGCLGDRYRNLNHHWIHEILVDINLAIQPDLIVTDGTICMEGNGPIHGPPKELGIIMASDNVLANDLVAIDIMKLDPSGIEHIVNAIRVGLGPANLSEVSIKGLKLSEFVDISFKPVDLDIVSNAAVFICNNRHLTRFFFQFPSNLSTL